MGGGKVIIVLKKGRGEGGRVFIHAQGISSSEKFNFKDPVLLYYCILERSSLNL